MSKNTNDGLARSGTRCFIAVDMATVGVKGLTAARNENENETDYAETKSGKRLIVAVLFIGNILQHSLQPQVLFSEHQNLNATYSVSQAEWGISLV